MMPSLCLVESGCTGMQPTISPMLISQTLSIGEASTFLELG